MQTEPEFSDKFLYLDYLYRNSLGSNITEYKTVFALMADEEFKALVPNDENRILDALQMRKSIIEQTGWNIEGPISLLEVIISLCNRLYQEVLSVPLTEINIKPLLSDMFNSSGLISYNDNIMQNSYEKYNEAYTIIYNINNRKYRCDGLGGLFYIPGTTMMPMTELWYQAMWYFDYIWRKKDTNTEIIENI